MDDLTGDDLPDALVAWLMRLIRAFTDDRDYAVNSQHVRERWDVLLREDAALARWLLNRWPGSVPKPGEGDR